MIKEYNLDFTLRNRLSDVPRRKWHVCKSDAGNADYLYDALPNGSLVHKVNDALAKAGDFDEVIVWPGEWVESATINITQEGLILRGANVGRGAGMGSTELWQYAGSQVPVITVAAKGVEICGLQILPYLSATDIGIAVGTAVEAKYCWIHDNYLRSVHAANMPTLISIGTAGTFDAQMAMVEDNYFRHGGNAGGTSGQIYFGQATGSIVRKNTFLTGGSTTNYNALHAGTAIVQRLLIQNNHFYAFEAGGLAIQDGTGTTTVGHMYIDGNNFIGYADNDHCFDYSTDNAGINWLNGAAITS